ncbi:hypothetical protein OK18_00705 [Chryseobacterium gallinarum]|uniref:Protein argonaute n=1 Tax=Chryseobacterium gallinarum TaxID=1324352 RepID=A0A0G3M2V2_CHRGL|nr:hypothetical protein [Chryseobacterium gallinarum]AKK71352.1 hypothetical protein OK18_00705 [Chryseobacterium gallinarum]
MKVKLLEEPTLEFGLGESICPKRGIAGMSPYDFDNVRPEKITLGFIGKSESIDNIASWLQTAKKSIKNNKQNLRNLFPDFPGFNRDLAFHSEIAYDQSYLRKLNNSDVEEIIKNSQDIDAVIEKIVHLYLTEIKFLTKNKKPDVILCILDDKLTSIFLTSGNKKKGSSKSIIDEADLNEEDLSETADDDFYSDGEINKKEYNFRRLLKARAMKFGVPIQIMRDKIANPSRDMQDPATIAWNFFTAIYYKASGTPWALKKETADIICYAGISFYRSRDKQTIQTSVTQIFNEHGKGVILRGAEVELKKGDREPHLSEEQAFELMDTALGEYYEALKIFPQRLVIHKSSNFSQSEIDGFRRATSKHKINSVDLVTIMSSPLRLFRDNIYPPLRGTMCTIDTKNYILYTRGFVNYFETYPGSYIPDPLLIRLFSHDESPEVICREILGLTKMNWNNTQFDRKYPITIECSRKVGDILKYLEPDEQPQLKYSFYM